MANCKPTSTPMDTQSKLSATDGTPATDSTFYRSITGALQYLTLTRPDIAYAVNQACLYMQDPHEAHWNLVKRILRYLRGSISQGILISASPSTELKAYSDADWAGCPDTRRSTSGTVCFSVSHWSLGPLNARPLSPGLAPRRNIELWPMQLQNVVGSGTCFKSYMSSSTRQR
jgi:hypothetical protein